MSETSNEEDLTIHLRKGIHCCELFHRAKKEQKSANLDSCRFEALLRHELENRRRNGVEVPEKQENIK